MDNVSAQVSKFYDAVLAKISESTYCSALLQQAEDKTGIPGPYIVTAVTSFLLIFFVLAYGPFVLCDVVVVFYPAYRSFNALEDNDSEKCKHLMKYWIVFGVYHAAEHIGDTFFWWLPGYHIIKFLFLVWCFTPIENNGSVFVYENYIRPAFQHNAETVDNVIKSVKSFSQHATSLPVQ